MILKGINYEIEEQKSKYPNERYIDIVLKIAEEKGIDIYDLVQILSKNIIENIKVEFIKANCVKNTKINDSLEKIFEDTNTL